MTAVVFVLLPGVHLLDLAGPAQAFHTARSLGHPYDLAYVAGAEPGEVLSAQGLALTATAEWPDLDPGDLLVVPGWRAAYDLVAGPRLSREAAERPPSLAMAMKRCSVLT